MSDQQPFKYVIRVRYGECDAQHVVYNPKYGEYFDLAATEFLRAVAAPGSAFDGSFEFQVVKLLVEWTGPARFDDVLEIAVRTTKIGNTSFVLGYEIRRPGETAPIVTGETVNVHVDHKTWQKKQISPEMRERLLHAADGKTVDQSGR